MLLIGGFLGSKLPKPPAIATTLALCIDPLSVITSNDPSSFFINLSAVSPRVYPGVNGFICSNKLSINEPAIISGIPGIS